MGHHSVGLGSPTDNPLVQLAQEGCIRLCGGKKIRKDAIPVEVIKSFVEAYSIGKPDAKRMRFIMLCLTGFAGFLRIQELLDVQLKHLTFREECMQVFLPYAKTDQHRNGETVYIAKTGTKYCPVKHVLSFLQEAGLDKDVDTEAYLIPRLHKTKKGHRASKTKGISYTRINEVFHEHINTGSGDENYGLHSLRSGGASAAAQNGVSDRLISKQGRWASETARNGYIMDSKKTRLSVSLSLGL